MVIAYDSSDDQRFRLEIAGLVIAGLVPIVGVLFFGWDVYAVMFIVSWEVIVTSAILGWLFNYPQRSTIAALGLVLVFAPVGLLMLTILDKAYEAARFAGMIRELFSQTWVAIALIAIYAGLACSGAMAKARERGVSIEANNRTLIMWIASVYLPFTVFAGVMAAEKSMGVLSLAAVLAVKTTVEAVSMLRKRARHKSA